MKKREVTEISTVSIEGRESKVGISEALVERSRSGISLGRPGTAEEAAGSAVLFCLPQSDYCSGQVLYGAGGPR